MRADHHQACDAVICGAGPAGALCALRLRQLRPALRVVVIEALRQPHAQPCGEFISPAGIRLLEKAGVETFRRADNQLHGLHLHAGRSCLRIGFHHHAGVGLAREELALRLRQALALAQVEIHHGERLQRLERRDARWELTTSTQTLTAALVIGADGRQSRVRELVGLTLPAQRSRCAVVARIHGMRFGPGPRVGEMHCSALGQVGVAPLTMEVANINLLLAPRGSELLKQLAPLALLRSALRLTPSLAARSRDCPLSGIMTTPSLPQRSRAVIGDGLALIGDAAGFWDPFTGDGISMALAQAEALARCLRDVDFTGAIPAGALHAYRDSWLVLTRVKRGGLLELVLPRRLLSEAVVRMLARFPLLGRAAVHYVLPSHQ